MILSSSWKGANLEFDEEYLIYIQRSLSQKENEPYIMERKSE
jgi:hypothetical protein